MRAFDLHAHYWPSGLLDAIEHEREWFGWQPRRGPDGVELRLGDVVLPFAPPKVDLADPATRTARRRQEQGIEAEAVMVVGFLWNTHLDAAAGARYCREVNQELAELERASPGHFRGLGLLPLQDTGAALAELDHAVGTLGLTSFAVPSHVEGRNLDDPSVIPVLDAMAERDVSISIHPPFFDKIGDKDRFSKHYFKSSFGAPIEASIGIMSLIYDGFLDRHPDVRLWVTHGGGVVPFTAGRFLTRWRSQDPADRPMQDEPPSYLSRIHVGCLVHDDASLRFLVDRIGIERITLGTDHPFAWDHPGGAANWVRGADFLTEEEKRAILWDNAARFLRFDADETASQHA